MQLRLPAAIKIRHHDGMRAGSECHHAIADLRGVDAVVLDNLFAVDREARAIVALGIKFVFARPRHREGARKAQRVVVLALRHGERKSLHDAFRIGLQPVELRQFG